jgi:DNA-binding transcriptional regulator LsrR (DeoR family)
VRRNPGVVNNHVKTAKLLARLFNGGKNLVAFRDIHLHRQRLAAVAVNFISDRLRGGVIIIGDSHGKTIFNQAKSNGFPDALARAGDECDFFIDRFLL